MGITIDTFGPLLFPASLITPLLIQSNANSSIGRGCGSTIAGTQSCSYPAVPSLKTGPYYQTSKVAVFLKPSGQNPPIRPLPLRAADSGLIGATSRIPGNAPYTPMPSYKTIVIERLFESRWNAADKDLFDPVVTLSDVQGELRAAIRRGVTASDRNAANFLYDIIRKDSANEHWPKSVFQAGYTGKQLVGNGLCFEFVRVEPNAKEPFPNKFGWSEATPVHEIQSLTLPEITRSLARTDEAAILQYTIALRLLETHFAIFSPLRVATLTHVSDSVRFNNVNIDALFLATLASATPTDRGSAALVTCECKQQDERILEDRIIRQIKAATLLETEANRIIPVVIQRAPNGCIYLCELLDVKREESADVERLSLSSSALYKLQPPIQGF